jgi:hypothetical protein
VIERENVVIVDRDYHGSPARLWYFGAAYICEGLTVVSPATHVTAIRRPTQIASTYSHNS